MINRQLILDRLALINSYIEGLEELSSMDKASFLHDKKNVAATESFLRRTLEAIFYIGRHILAKTGGIDMSMEYKAIARGLGEKGIIKDDLRDKLIQMAGYRNRMVHMYHMINDEELYDIITTELDDIKEFVSEIKKYIGSVHD